MSHLNCNSCKVSLTTFMILQSRVADFQALYSPLIWCKRPNQASAEGNRLPKGNTKTDYAENIMRTKQKNSTNEVKENSNCFSINGLMSYLTTAVEKPRYLAMCSPDLYMAGWPGGYLQYRLWVHWFPTAAAPSHHLLFPSEKCHGEVGAQQN